MHLEDQQQVHQRVQPAVPHKRLAHGLVGPCGHTRVRLGNEPRQRVLLRVPCRTADLRIAQYMVSVSSMRWCQAIL